ncbi:MAG: hypothetical protein K2L42_02950 [Clostridia bacterium]|nr:hypothetical protein [Clostridia bacterium]
MDFCRGSEWRRWDLHIHTPQTKKNDQFVGSTPQEKWDKFYENILTYINSEDPTKKVAVLGITDYFSIDNYRKVISDGKLTDKFELILPNIEMRITPVSSKAAMNIHFICNPNIVSQLDVKLFSQLTFNHSNGQTFRAVKDDFIKLGRLFDATLTDDAAYRKGIEQFVVDLSNLKQILDDKDLRENVIVVVSNSSNDGASGIGNSSRPNANSDLTIVRDDLCYFADMFFCATESSIKYFLGDGSLTKEQIVQKYGRLKPCVHGCDAHKNSDILAPDNNRYCWIKADCTFEGLKQIIYEPKERVKICDTHPETKRDYNVIDKITISDERFSPTPIVFNPNLTCFIGGKSTGKSIILNNMARLIDCDQYKLKYSGKDFTIQNMKVYWKDGTISEGTDKKNIVYIPQTYLNSLSDNQEEKTEIDAIIQDIILQDEEIKKAYEDFQHDLGETKTALDKEIYDTVKAHEAFLLYSQQLTENGSAESIKKEISKLQKERDRITKLLQISEEDIAKYDQCKTRLTALVKILETKQKDIHIFSELSLVVRTTNDSEGLSVESQRKVDKFIGKYTDTINHDWDEERQKILSDLNADIEKINSEISTLKVEIEAKEQLLEKTEALKTTNAMLIEEEKKLKTAEMLQAQVQTQKQVFEDLLKRIIHKLAIFDSLHQKYASFVNEKAKGLDSSMTFLATAPFRLEAFDGKIRDLFNNKKLKAIYVFYEDANPADISEDILEKLIRPLFEFDGKSLLKKSFTLEEALRGILSNWYNIIYTIELDEDKIQTMSPGKKALVLLKLLINLADSDCPILIDQPEDDLDNRSIYYELVDFLRQKKYDRQIIIVTHNANIVLGSDSEEIIVANQKGANSPNEIYRFEYRSGSIENNTILKNSDGSVKNGILNQKGIQGHICEILEGGKEAFNVRKDKYTLV